MSFYQFLIEKGYSKEEANMACVCAENDLPMSKDLDELYAYWWDKMFREACRKE